MANQTPSRAGQVNNAGDPLALWLTVFGGEVLTAFATATKFKERHVIRQIQSGRSAQFPATGRAAAFTHLAGEEIMGQAIPGNERKIDIDNMLISPVFLADIDEAMEHWDVRQEYSRQCGLAMARHYDKNVARVGIKAARAASNVTGLPGGSKLIHASAKADASVLIDQIFEARQALAEKDVPEDSEGFVFLRPDQYFLLVNSGSRAIHADTAGEANGGIASGMIQRIAGFELVMTNQLPNTDETAVGSTVDPKYAVNAAATAALVMTREAVGTVQLLDLSVRADYDPRRLGTQVVAKYAVGHGVLRPECAVEIATA